MPINPLDDVSPGQPIVPSASRDNRIVAAVRLVESMRSTGGSSNGLTDPHGTILVKNNSGVDQERFAILGMSGVLRTPDVNEDNFQNEVNLVGTIPVDPDHVGAFVVLQEPIANGKLGKAWAFGFAVVKMKGGGAFVDIVDGETGFLVASATGSARVIYSDPVVDPDVPRWAKVRLMDPRVPGRIRFGRANSDWTPYSTLSVQVYDEGGRTAVAVDCLAPGTDGEDMACCRGRIVPTDGILPLKYEFDPTECTPSKTGSDCADDPS